MEGRMWRRLIENERNRVGKQAKPGTAANPHAYENKNRKRGSIADPMK